MEDMIEEEPYGAKKLNQLRMSLKNILTSLPPREQEILTMRFGLNGGDCCTLKDVSAFFNITTVRIRQIEAKALRRILHPRKPVFGLSTTFQNSQMNTTQSIKATQFLSQKQKEIKAILYTLPHFDQMIVTVRFGLEGGIEHSVEEICNTFHITMDDVKKIEEKVHRRINHKPDNFINITMEE